MWLRCLRRLFRWKFSVKWRLHVKSAQMQADFTYMLEVAYTRQRYALIMTQTVQQTKLQLYQAFE